MDRTTVEWRGYWPAAPTPFEEDGAIAESTFRAVLEQYVADGVHGVLINGSAGEWWVQSDAERHRVAEIAVEAVAGRIPVLVGCTDFTAEQVIAHAAHAATIGASGALSTPPPYAHPTQEEVLAFYRAIDAAAELPLVAYNWPRGTAVEISLDTARRIAELDHVVAIKNSTADWDLVIDYIEALADEVRIFSSLINPRGLAILRELGGDGYIDGGGLGAPFAVPFFEALWRDDLPTAREHAATYARLMSGLVEADFGGRFGSPSSQLKAAMKLLGQSGGEVRPPQQPTIDRERVDGLASVLRDVGLLV